MCGAAGCTAWLCEKSTKERSGEEKHTTPIIKEKCPNPPLRLGSSLYLKNMELYPWVILRHFYHKPQPKDMSYELFSSISQTWGDSLPKVDISSICYSPLYRFRLWWHLLMSLLLRFHWQNSTWWTPTPTWNKTAEEKHTVTCLHAARVVLTECF